MAKSPKKAAKKATTVKQNVCRPKNKPTSLGSVVVKYDVGFTNSIFIRGRGAGLSWDRGVPLKNVGPDEWLWEPSQTFNECEFKVLVNDDKYEEGDNHHMSCGETKCYIPRF